MDSSAFSSCKLRLHIGLLKGKGFLPTFHAIKTDLVYQDPCLKGRGQAFCSANPPWWGTVYVLYTCKTGRGSGGLCSGVCTGGWQVREVGKHNCCFESLTHLLSRCSRRSARVACVRHAKHTRADTPASSALLLCPFLGPQI